MQAASVARATEQIDITSYSYNVHSCGPNIELCYSIAACVLLELDRVLFCLYLLVPSEPPRAFFGKTIVGH